MAQTARIGVFLGAMALGLWGFVALPGFWSVAAFVTAFLVGGIASHIAFKRLATPDQIREDLRERADSID